MSYQEKMKSLEKKVKSIIKLPSTNNQEGLLTQILDQETLLILIFHRRTQEILWLMETFMDFKLLIVKTTLITGIQSK